MRQNVEIKIEGAGVTSTSRMVKIGGRSFRMTTTTSKKEASSVAKPASKMSSSFAQLAQNVAKAKAKSKKH